MPTTTLPARPLLLERVPFGGDVACIDVVVDRPDKLVAIMTLRGGTRVVAKAAREPLGDVPAITHLASAGIPIQSVVEQGHTEGVHWAILSYVPGQPLDHTETAAARQAGQVLRRIHQVPPPARTQPYSDRIAAWVDDVTCWLRAAGTNQAAIADLRQFYNDAAQHLVDADRFTILNDGRADHFLVDAGQLSGLIDVADVTRGDFAMDLVVLAGNNRDLHRQVVDGYRPTAAEQQHLDAVAPFYRLLRRVTAAQWHDSIGQPDVSDALLRSIPHALRA